MSDQEFSSTWDQSMITEFTRVRPWPGPWPGGRFCQWSCWTPSVCGPPGYCPEGGWCQWWAGTRRCWSGAGPAVQNQLSEIPYTEKLNIFYWVILKNQDSFFLCLLKVLYKDKALESYVYGKSHWAHFRRWNNRNKTLLSWYYALFLRINA